jgi:transcriptional regulator with XRE-family HTH domain
MAQDYPFKQLGSQMRTMRETAGRTIAEVSGAVEIEPAILASIELGKERPTEDLLFLLMSYFSIKDDEATRLWKLAGFEEESLALDDMPESELANGRQSVSVLQGDARIIYTDMVHVMVNNYGVVMNFMQGGGPNMQPLAVARVGMSKEHAKSVLEVLKQTLTQSEQGPSLQKALPEDTQA